MSSENACGKCRHFVAYNQDMRENGGVCLKMWFNDVYPNHTPLYTFERCGTEIQAINLLADPEETCFEKRAERIIDFSVLKRMDKSLISEKASLH